MDRVDYCLPRMIMVFEVLWNICEAIGLLLVCVNRLKLSVTTPSTPRDYPATVPSHFGIRDALHCEP